MTTPALQAQQRLDSRSPMEVVIVKPARKIDVDRGEFDNHDYNFRIWNMIVFPFVDNHGERHTFLCAIRIVMQIDQKLLTSLFAPSLNYLDPRFESIVVLHQNNDERIIREFGKTFDELMDILNVRGNAQFVETKYDLIPVGWRSPSKTERSERKKLDQQKDEELSRGFWLKKVDNGPVWQKVSESYMIFPFNTGFHMGSTEELNLNSSQKGHTELLFFDHNGDGYSVFNFSIEEQETWQKYSGLDISGMERMIHEKTSKVPTNSGTRRQKDYVCNAMYDMAIRFQKNAVDDGWIDVPDIDTLRNDFRNDLKSYKALRQYI